MRAALTAREYLQHAARGRSARETGEALAVGERTFQTYRATGLTMLDVASCHETVAKVIKLGLIDA